ncbi:MAG TPA: GntR family transcriptional regulator [Solirubrobacterales bacterium]|nr:GntR family transcriptional regulator [Solirubrobacterales bacterium]
MSGTAPKGRLPKVETVSNLTEQVHDLLLGAIVDGTLEAGTLYSVQALADQFGVSRTPVREAMLQLARRGIVEMVRNQGVLIVQRSLEDLRDIFQIRLWLEVPAVRDAVPKMDAADLERIHATFGRMRAFAREGDARGLENEDRMLHRAILECSGNLRVAAMIDDLRDFVIAQGKTTTGRSRTLPQIVEAHGDLIAAIDRGDAEGAAQAMARHLESTSDALLAQFADELG